MPLFQFVITLLVVGMILWMINKQVPLRQTVAKKILNAAEVVILCLLSIFGVVGALAGFSFGG
jgi:hypothetical protein